MTRRSMTDSHGRRVWTSVLRIQVCVMDTKLEHFSCREALLVSRNSSDPIWDPRGIRAPKKMSPPSHRNETNHSLLARGEDCADDTDRDVI